VASTEILTQLPILQVETEWSELLLTKQLDLEYVLPQFIVTQRWFGQKGRTIGNVRITTVNPQGTFGNGCYLTLIDVRFVDGAIEQYLLPLALTPHNEGEPNEGRPIDGVICTIARSSGRVLGVLHDAVYDCRFVLTLLRLWGTHEELANEEFSLFAKPSQSFPRPFAADSFDAIDLKPLGVEQSNSSLRVGEHLVIKIIRRVENGENPEVEIGNYLTRTVGFVHSPPTMGAITLRQKHHDNQATIAILQQYVPNDGDAWSYTQREIAAYFSRVPYDSPLEFFPPTIEGLLNGDFSSNAPRIFELIGPILTAAQLLGQRTAELHLAFAQSTDEAFVQEPLSREDRLRLHKHFLTSASRCLQSLKAYVYNLTGHVKEKAIELLAKEARILTIFNAIRDHNIVASNIRIHGDYHLGQVLLCHNDFVIIDFEGEPTSSIRERALKRSPLRDVAGMLRSIDYAAKSACSRHNADVDASISMLNGSRLWAELWSTWMSAQFLEGYFRTSRSASYLPKDKTDLTILLKVFLLEKALYEIEYELGHRPDWIHIPIDAVIRMIDSETTE
jgi:maltose alpha-D-glucosyltransferase/alpha-amylase